MLLPIACISSAGKPQHTGILAASDVLVLPSQWEGMPNVVLEAMAVGRPVLAADMRGLRELLGDSGEQIAPPMDVGRWLAMLQRLLADEKP